VLLAFVRKKTIKGRNYYYLVKSVREGSKVRQKVIKYLGSRKPRKEVWGKISRKK
jgi:hypothetical protein